MARIEGIAGGAGLATTSQEFAATLSGKVVITVAASLFVAVCSHLVVPGWFTPVPFTLADLAVVLVGLVLGPVMGFSALTLYLVEGACGLPVFSPTGPGGLLQLFGVTGGYLVAYPFAAGLAGFVSRAFGRQLRFLPALIGAAAGSSLLMISGTVWLGHFLHLAPAVALAKGATPFIPGQLVKVLSAAGIATSVRHLRRD